MIPALEFAAGCVLLASNLQEGTGEARILVGEGCRTLTVVAGPGLTMSSLSAQARLSDDTRRELGPERWLPSPREVDGSQRTRLVFPDLLPQDVIDLRLAYARYDHPSVSPGETQDVHVSRTLVLEVPEGVDPLVALVPGKGSTWRWDDVWTLPAADRSRATFVPAPPGAVTRGEALDGGGVAFTGDPAAPDGVWLQASPGEAARFRVTTTGPDAPLCGRIEAPAGVTLDGFQVQVAGADTWSADGWWGVETWSKHPIYDEAARTVAILDARYRGVSLPEPGLPMRVRGRLDGWTFAAELPAILRRRAAVTPLSIDPIWPRKLAAARRSGVVSPLEAALIVRAYALQGRFEADWALVRPADLGAGDARCPTGHPEALVRIRFEGADRWVDPGCPECGPFEVRPELTGASAIGPWVVASPEIARGTFRVEVGGRDVIWRLTGAAALELRRSVREIPVDQRPAALATRMAGSGAVLASAEGFSRPGDDIVLVARAADVSQLPAPAAVLLPRARPDGRIFFPWSGPRTWVRVGQHPEGTQPPSWTIESETRFWSRDEVQRWTDWLSHPLLTTP